jgi:low temperature requirement protein LtrA
VSDVPAENPSDSVERHASWLELFFDLVVVVAVAQLAHLLLGHEGAATTAHDVIEFVVLYLAIWLLWVSFTLYANVAGESTRRRSMIVGMAGIAVMAAAISEATGDRGTVFAIAYVVTRVAGMRTWESTGKILLSWPAAQRGAGLIPWIASLWVGQPAQFRLWTVGVAIDLWFSIAGDRDPERLRQRISRVAERQEQRTRRRGAAQGRRFRLTFTEPDLPHLGERLGLFVIIVLGEAIAQIVSTAAGIDWTWQNTVPSAAGFVLVIGMWRLSFEYGFGNSGALPPTVFLPVHFATVASITAVAAGIGITAAHPADHLPAVARGILCAGLAVFLLATAVLRKSLHGWPIQLLLLVLPVGPAVFGWAMPAAALPWLLAVVLAGQQTFLRWSTREKAA